VGVAALFTHSVACAAEDHEVEKNRALCKAITHQDMASSAPCLTVPTTLLQAALQLVQGLGWEPGHYVVGCPAGSVHVPIKVWPDDSYLAVSDPPQHQYPLPVLLTGVASEAAQLHAIAQETRSRGVRVAVWIGGGDDVGLLLGILRHSRLYVGTDTGPM